MACTNAPAAPRSHSRSELPRRCRSRRVAGVLEARTHPVLVRGEVSAASRASEASAAGRDGAQREEQVGEVVCRRVGRGEGLGVRDLARDPGLHRQGHRERGRRLPERDRLRSGQRADGRELAHRLVLGDEGCSSSHRIRRPEREAGGDPLPDPRHGAGRRGGLEQPDRPRVRAGQQACDQLRGELLRDLELARVHRPGHRSSTSASPCPPPPHSPTAAVPLPRRTSSCAMCTTSRVPEAPIG